MANTFKLKTKASVGVTTTGVYVVPASTTTVVIGITASNVSGNNINVGVGILRRESTQTDEGEGITALSHRDITEVYYVLSGSGILETGGDGEGDREFPPASSLVRELVGPTDVRTVKNGETMTISAGDVVVIPAGVLHGFRKILDQITYLSIRIDPDQVLPA